MTQFTDEENEDLPGVARLLQRHNIRRRTMSSLQRPPPLSSCFSSPEPGTSSPVSSRILRSLQEASEPISSLPDIREHSPRPPSRTRDTPPTASPSPTEPTPPTEPIGKRDETRVKCSTDSEGEGGEQFPLVTRSEENRNGQGSQNLNSDEYV